MLRWAKHLSALGPVFPFDYPYVKERRRAPDRVPVLVAAHREAVLQARRQHGADREESDLGVTQPILAEKAEPSRTEHLIQRAVLGQHGAESDP